jgi:hypothetical protein
VEAKLEPIAIYSTGYGLRLEDMNQCEAFLIKFLKVIKILTQEKKTTKNKH